MKRLMVKISAIFFAVSALALDAHALTVLKGAEADNYLGDLKQHIISGVYTYEILSRSHRDAMHGRFSDALIFNTGGGNFDYPKRKNGQHLFVIDAPDGREEEPVTEDTWRQKIKNTLSDDNNIPYVFLDDAQKELAIVFVGKGTQVQGKINDRGLLQVELEVDGARDERSSGRRRH